MTSLEMERLVRRITGVIQQTMDASLAPKLAADYQEAVRTVQLRLSQCETMIRAGDHTQAVQLAETTPSLLDCIALLEFAEVDEWRSYCINQRLSCPEPIDARAVRLLNECYTRGIKTDDPLYKAYRKAVLTRDDSEALKTIRSIARLNPQDTSASAERDRLDRKVLEGRLKVLAAALAANENKAVLEVVREIEAFGFQTRPGGEVWSQAQLVRCQELLESTTDDQAQSRWREVLLTLDFIRNLQADFRFQLPPAAASRFAAAESWARNEEHKDRRDREFRSLLAELHHTADLSEQKDTAAKGATLSELKTDLEQFHRIWRALEQFARPVTPEAEQRFRKRTVLLGMEIRRRHHRRLAWFGASVALIFLLGGAVTWLVLGRAQAGEFSGQLKTAMQNRQAGTVRKVSALVHESPPRLLGYGDLAATLAAAEEFLQTEQSREAAYQTALARLPAEFPAAPKAAQLILIQHQLSETTNLLAQLAPDLRDMHAGEVTAFQNKWDGFLADQTAAANAALERSLQQGEQLVSALSYARPPEEIRTRLEDLAAVEAAVGAFAGGPNVPVRLRADLEHRAARLSVTGAEYRRELERYEQGQRKLAEARDLAAFEEALALLSRSEFNSASAVPAARAMAGLKHSADGVLRGLLFPANPGLLDLLRSSREFSFLPQSIMPKERELFLRLQNDAAVSKLHHCYKVFYQNDSHAPVEWITPAMIDQTEGTFPVPVFVAGSGEGRFELRPFELTYAKGAYSLPNGESFSRIELSLGGHESAAYAAAQAGSLIDSTGEAYGRALIPIIEGVIKSPEGSPLHKAYVTIRLVELAQLRPEEWGLPFAPQLTELRNELLQAGAGEVRSGDWFLPERTKLYSDRLARVLNRVASVPLWNNAQNLARLAGRMAHDGLVYAGYVNVAGQPVVTMEHPPGELLGLVRDASGPGVLFVRAAQQWQAARPPQALSPLFALGAEPAELLAAAGIDASQPEIRRTLPAILAPRTTGR